MPLRTDELLTPAARLNYDDTWSPAVMQPSLPHVYYWPNITCSSRQAAIDRARESIERISSASEILQWNVWPDTMAEYD